MNRKEEQAPENMLRSSDFEVRRRGLGELYLDEEFVKRLYRLLLSYTGNIATAEDLLNEAFYKIMRVIVNGPLDKGSPRGYIWRTVVNLANDWYKREKGVGWRHLPLDGQPRPRVHLLTQNAMEESLIKLEEVANPREEVKALSLHLPDEWDRLVALLCFRLGLNQLKMHLLFGWGINEIENSIRRVARILPKLYSRKDEYLSTLHPWEAKLSFTNVQGALCTNILNVFPKEFQPDSLRMLLKDFEVANLQELYEKYIAMVRIENIESPNARFILTFSRREHFNSEVIYDGRPIYYQDYIVNFETMGKKGGGWKLVITLAPANTYSCKAKKLLYDKRGIAIGIVFQFPDFGVELHKPYDMLFLNYLHNPHSQQGNMLIYRYQDRSFS